MNRPISKATANIIFLSLVFLFTGCEEIEHVGRSTDSIILYKLSQLANWSVLWLIPPLIIYFLIARDRDEMRETLVSGRSTSGKYETIFTKVPTGRIIKGDPEFGKLMGLLWVICYPIGYLYYNFLTNTEVQIGSSVEFNVFIFLMLIPAIILTVIGLTLHRVLTDKNNPLSILLTRITVYTVGFCFINMVCWLLVMYLLKYH